MLVSAGTDVNMLFDHNFTEEMVALLPCVLTLSSGTISSIAGDVKSTAQGWASSMCVYPEKTIILPRSVRAVWELGNSADIVHYSYKNK